MSDRTKNHVLILLGIATAVTTICIQLLSVGELKGKVETVIGQHERRIGGIEGEVSRHSSSISNIEGRLHGIASQIGKVPSRVAEKMQSDE